MLSGPMRDRSAPALPRAAAFWLLAASAAGALCVTLGSTRAAHAEPPLARVAAPEPSPVLVASVGDVDPLAALAPPILGLPGRYKNPGGKDNAQAHAFFDDTGNCDKCHVSGGGKNTVSNAKCAAEGCHASDIGRDLKNKTGFHGRSKQVVNGTCGDCHDEHNGLGFDLINGKKDKVETLKPGERVEATPWAIAMGAANNLGAGPNSWNHDLTGYKLIGGHKVGNARNNVKCDDCHKPTMKRPKSATRTFLGLDQDCLSCHDNYHNFKKGDRFEDCLTCHTFTDWNRTFNLTGFDHDKETKFALNGAHERVGCANCHAKGKPFAPVPHDTCETCHESDSIHGNTFKSRPCVYCHTESSWRNEKVKTEDHEKFAKFDAVGAHARLPCVTCHKGLKSTPPKAAENENNCAACHTNIHGSEWVKDQAKGCLRCHTNTRWAPATVDNKDHKDFAKWTLFAPGDDAKAQAKGKHMQLQCVRCHRDLAEVPQKQECVFCHVDWHATLASADPVQGKPTTPPATRPNCADCHGTAGWEETSFNHDKTNFPLTGKHRTVGCEQCHKDSAVTKSYKHDTACNSCHGDPHLGKLDLKCDKCHSPEGWEDEKFDHNKDSDYKLVGKHLQVDCYKCHLDMGFVDTPDQCPACHLDYHKGAWGPISCEQCHNERRWAVERGTLVFPTLHNFGDVVLTGVHEKLECETCHAPNPRWLMNGMGGECNQCHADPHLGGRGQECHTCHSQSAWLPAEFNHAFTGFPLTGTHRLVGCVECHRGSIYSGTPDDCVFCHADDAQQTHGLCDASGVCQECHNTVAWRGTTGTTPNCLNRP